MKTKTMILVSLLALASVQVRAEDGVKWSGFFDAQFHGANNSALSENFTIHDGAVYVNGTWGSTKATLDIPFGLVREVNGPGDVNEYFGLGAGKAQAYVEHTYDFGLTWKLGQWDTFFGYELRDSADLQYTRAGLVYDMIPSVHQGLMLSYKIIDGVNFGLMGANNQSHLNRDPEFGANLNAKFGDFRFAVSGMIHSVGDEMESTYDILAGATFGSLAVDLEAVLKKGAAANAETEIGILGNIGYTINDMIAAGVRVENVTDAAKTNTMQFTFGPQLTLNSNVR